MSLTATGLIIKRVPEIETDLLNNERQNIDANISAEDNEVAGQLNSVNATSIGEVWELLQFLYDIFNLDKAEGIHLDNLATLNGLKRIDGTKSLGIQRIVAEPNTIVPQGTVFRNPVTADRFFLLANTTVSNSDCYSVKYSVVSLLNNNDYIISVNGISYEYTSDANATELEVLNGLKAAIDADLDKTWTAEVDEDTLQLIVTTDDDNDIAVLSTSYIGPDEVTVDAEAEAEFTGATVAPPTTVTEIVTLISGLISTTNPESYILGRDRETDEEFRLRIKNSQQVLGRGTVEAIQDQLSNVDGVTSAQVIENDTDVVDGDGRPPHSFESVVVGGDNDEVALTIWESKGAGIATFGNTAVIIEDSNNVERTINFTRPTIINVAIRITYTLYSEEDFPVDGEDTIEQIALEHLNDLGLDVDVIPQRFFGPIYTGVPGIDSLVVEVQQITNPGDTPSGVAWQTSKLEIDFDEISSTTEADIYIVGP